MPTCVGLLRKYLPKFIYGSRAQCIIWVLGLFVPFLQTAQTPQTDLYMNIFLSYVSGSPRDFDSCAVRREAVRGVDSMLLSTT